MPTGSEENRWHAVCHQCWHVFRPPPENKASVTKTYHADIFATASTKSARNLNSARPWLVTNAFTGDLRHYDNAKHRRPYPCWYVRQPVAFAYRCPPRSPAIHQHKHDPIVPARQKPATPPIFPAAFHPEPLFHDHFTQLARIMRKFYNPGKRHSPTKCRPRHLNRQHAQKQSAAPLRGD